MNIGRLEWSDQLRIGIGQLDDGHKELIDLYNRIVWLCANAPTRGDLRERIRSFVSYGRHHFRQEEEYMIEVHYPEYIPHKTEHDRLLQDAEDFIENLGGSLSLNDGEAILKYFRYWLLRHIATDDAKLNSFVIACDAADTSAADDPDRGNRSCVAEK